MATLLGVKRATISGHMPLDEECDPNQAADLAQMNRADLEAVAPAAAGQQYGYSNFSNPVTPSNRLAPLSHCMAAHHVNMGLAVDEELQLDVAPSAQGASLNTRSAASPTDPSAVATVMQAANYVMDAVRPVPRDNLDQPLLSRSQHSLHTATAKQEPPRDANPGERIAGDARQSISATSGGGYIGPRYSVSSIAESSAINGDLSRGVGNANIAGRMMPVVQSKPNDTAVVYRRTDRPRYVSQISNGSRASSIRGSTIVFKQINYVVTTKKMPWSKPVQVQVLSNVS